MKLSEILNFNKKNDNIKDLERKKNDAMSWIPIKDIQGEYVFTKDKRVISVLEVFPKNIDLLTSNDMEKIITELRKIVETYHTNHIQIFCSYKKVDLSIYLNNLKEASSLKDANTPEGIKDRQILQMYQKQCKNFITEKNAIQRVFYILIDQRYTKKSIDELTAKITNISKNLTKAEFHSKILNESELLDLYRNYFNPCVANIKLKDELGVNVPLVNYDKERVERKNEDKEEDVVFTGDANNKIKMLAPLGIGFEHDRFYFNKHSRVFAVMSYPQSLDAGWLSKIATTPNVIVSMHLNPCNSTVLTKKIDNIIQESVARLSNPTIRASEVQEIQKLIETSSQLMKMISSDNLKVNYMTLIIQIIASDNDELESRSQEIEGLCSAYSMRIKTLNFKQEQGFLSVMPICYIDEDIEKTCFANVPSTTAVSSLPFHNGSINDRSGVFLGTDSESSICLVDFFNRHGSRTNSNITILGKSGMGKSTLMKKVLLSLKPLDFDIYIIDPEREYQELTQSLNGSWLDLGGSSDNRINVLEINNLADVDDKSKQSNLSLHLNFLTTFFELYFGYSSNQDTTSVKYLIEVLEELYLKFGITYETTSAEISNMKSSEFPTFSDLQSLIVEKIKETEDSESKKENLLSTYEILRLNIRKLSEGKDASIFNGHTNLSIGSSISCFDINTLQDGGADELKRAQFFNLFNYIWKLASRDRERKKLILIDEAHLLIDPNNTKNLDFLRSIIKRARKYNIGVCITTQNLEDFLSPEVRRSGGALLSNSTYRFFLGLGENELSASKELFDLKDGEIEAIRRSQRGQSMVLAGNDRAFIDIYVSNEELRMFGTGGGK
jgi:type IV secretory pathway VirB4 component